MHTLRRALRLAGIVVFAASLQACDRQRADPRSSAPPEPASQDPVRTSELLPGGMRAAQPRANPYSGDGPAIREGERLYGWFNCSGCHAGGGGGMGPALMDSVWIYGSRPEQLYDTIVSGRPGGMPAFGGMIPPQQVWQIIAYIETMGGMEGGGDQRSGSGPHDPTATAPGQDSGAPERRPATGEQKE